jgi:DNA processing protein
MDQDLKLWGFLQAFQQSPYKYLYMNSMIEALEAVEFACRDELIKKILERNPSSDFWLSKLLPVSEKIFSREKENYKDGIQFIFYGQKKFPIQLRQMSDPPLALSYQGDLDLVSRFAISVVGSREPGELSKEWMQMELYQFLKRNRPNVISGGARGVDQKAHLIATLLDIPTVVILPSGLASKYPALWNEPHWIEKSIVFVSEMLLGDRISKRNFSSRNRLIAAWGIATLIVEARKKSGTLITAHHALGEGRPLWIVPGHPQVPSFSGSLELAFDHGQIVRNASDMSMLYEAECSDYIRTPLSLV